MGEFNLMSAEQRAFQRFREAYVKGKGRGVPDWEIADAYANEMANESKQHLKDQIRGLIAEYEERITSLEETDSIAGRTVVNELRRTVEQLTKILE